MAQVPPAPGTPVKTSYYYDLQVTSVQDGPLLENQPIEVRYTLTVKALGLRDKLPPPREGRICGTDLDNCVSIGMLPIGRRATGRITTTTQAGVAAPIRIVLASPVVCNPATECFGTDQLAEASVARPVAARYSVTLDRFEIRHTRARHNDTLFAYLKGAVAGQLSATPDQCSVYGLNYCTGVRLGDFNNGSSPKSWPIQAVRVGTYDIVPERDGDLKVLYALVNDGFSAEEAGFKRTLDVINGAAGAAMQAAYGGGWGGVQAFTASLNNLIVANCDGPVFTGGKLFLNRAIDGPADVTLDALTRGNGQLHIEEPLQVTKSQDGCGASSEYRVWWSVRRDSWRLPKEFRVSHSTLSL